MSLVYTPFKGDLLRGGHNLTTADMRILLAMTNTTFDTEQDDEFVGDTTTADEYDGAAYVRKALAGEAVTDDAPNDRGEFDANDVQWVALGAGTRQAAGIVLFRFVTVDADSPLAAWIDSGGFPFSGNGGNVDVAWNAEGILQAT
jgi:hypothetical protein